MYFDPGTFISNKEGKIFRVTGVKMENDGSFIYSIVPVHEDPEYSQVITGEQISKYKKM